MRRAVLEHVQIEIRFELQARPSHALGAAGGGVGPVAGVWCLVFRVWGLGVGAGGLGFGRLVLWGAGLCGFLL